MAKSYGRSATDAIRRDRPLSPHLTIYRPQITSISSIFTRIAGNALLFGSLLVVYWFIALATGPEAYKTADTLLTCWLGDLIMSLSLLALWYHLIFGLRHLIWDSGRMLEVEQSERYAVVGAAAALALTVITIVVL